MSTVNGLKRLLRSELLGRAAAESWGAAGRGEVALERLRGDVAAAAGVLSPELREAASTAFGSPERFEERVTDFWLVESLRELLEREAHNRHAGNDHLQLSLVDMWGRSLAARSLLERCVRPDREELELRVDVLALTALLQELAGRLLTVALQLGSPLARAPLWDIVGLGNAGSGDSLAAEPRAPRTLI